MSKSSLIMLSVLVLLLGADALSLAQTNGSRRNSLRSNGTSRQTNASTTPSTSASRPAWERYRVIVDRNIFLRERNGRRTADLFGSIPGGATTAPSTQPLLASDVRQRYVVTGTVLVGAERLVFIEDSTTGATSRVKPGESVGGTRVRSVGLDHVIVDSGEDGRRVAIGETLGGGASILPAPTTGPAPGGASSSSEAAILERLRARREKELSR